MNKRGQISESAIKEEIDSLKLSRDKKHKQKIMVYLAVSVFLVIIIASVFALFFYFINNIPNDINDTLMDNNTNIPNPISNPETESPSPNVSRGRNNRTNTTGWTSGTGGGNGGTGGTGETTTPTCTPSKTCSDYPGMCGAGLFNGCSNSLDCSNNCLANEFCYYGQGASNAICLNETQRCIDSDGINYFTTGFVNKSNNIYNDICSGLDLTEPYCFFNNTTKINEIRNMQNHCDFNCTDGRCITGVPENLVEMFNRKSRHATAVWNASYLENPVTYVWQPETLMYRDVITGHEVWKVSIAPNQSSIWHNDLGIQSWSADGKRMAIASQRISRAVSWSSLSRFTWMVMSADGSNLRPIVESENPTMNSIDVYFHWSPQIPDTYYEVGYQYEYPNSRKFYEVSVNDSSVSPVQIATLPENVKIEKLVSPDGRKAILMSRSELRLYPVTLYPTLNIDVSAGYSSDRNYLPYGSTLLTVRTSDYFHDQYYAGDGTWFFIVQEGANAWHRIKSLGSASDGGPVCRESDYPITDPMHDFGECWPENTISSRTYKYNHTGVIGSLSVGDNITAVVGGQNASGKIYRISSSDIYIYPYTYPFNWGFGIQIKKSDNDYVNTTSNGVSYTDPYHCDLWSHFNNDRWGRYALFSSGDNFPYGPGVWNIQNHSYSVSAFGGGATHNSWNGFTDWTVTSSNGYYSTQDTEDHYLITNGTAIIDVLGQKILAQKYNDINSQILVCSSYPYYNHPVGERYKDSGANYLVRARPGESPDGTKVAWHSEFLNEIKKSDAFWAVVYYPYPATDLSASSNNGVKISFLPPKYTERGWPFVNETLNKLRNSSWPELDSNGNEIGEPLYAREIKKFHVWRASGVNGPWTEIGTVDYLQNYTYHATEDPRNELMMLHPVDASGYRITPLNKLSYTDNPVDGTYYYAITSEEHSGLESDELSEILQVTYSSGGVSSSVVLPKGQKNFWTTLPGSPTNFNYYATGVSGHYNLIWTEPADSKIRYYNIYYSNSSNPQKTQQYRIASIPVGNNKYLDWLADPNHQGYYGITSVDRYGNEGNIVYIGGGSGGGGGGMSSQSSEVFTLNPFEKLINWFRQIFHLEPLNYIRIRFLN